MARRRTVHDEEVEELEQLNLVLLINTLATCLSAAATIVLLLVTLL